jgi:tartrate-resistant acid phosphatase type 5
MEKNIFLIAGMASVIIFNSCSGPKTTTAPIITAIATTKSDSLVTSATFSKAFNFIILSDWGRNGIADQQEVADQMAKTADSASVEFIATCGDNFQINGVASAQDPLWMVNFENVYKGNSLQVDWYPVLGNHDYKGNTQAEIDYSKVSRRWSMKERYYSFARKINDSISARFIFIDTPPLIEEYRNNPEEYPDAIKQNAEMEIKWLKDVLANSKEQWKLVFGHHPVYSASQKHGNTNELISKIKPLLEQYNAQFYICGHDHDFQHLREKNGKVDYIVTGTGSETRSSSSNEMSLFSKSEPGFSVVSLKADSLRICFIGIKGNIIYSYIRSDIQRSGF